MCRMFRIVKIFILVLLCNGALPSSAADVTNENQQATIQLINHVGYVLSVILNANDMFVLEGEFNNIASGNLNNDTIKDRGGVVLINDISEAIVDLRNNAGDLALLYDAYEARQKDALYSSFPSPLVLISANPGTLLVNAGQAIFSGVVNYKRVKSELGLALKKEEWQLDKDRFEDLSMLQSKLREKFWVLQKDYKIPDAWRTSNEQLGELIERCADTDTKRVYSYLCDKEAALNKSPVYWFQRAKAELTLGKEIAAFESFCKVEAEYRPVVRRSKMIAETALGLATLGIKLAKGDPFVKEQLRVAEENTDDSVILYLSASCFYSLKDYNNAGRLLRKNIDRMEVARNKKIQQYEDVKSRGKNKIAQEDEEPRRECGSQQERIRIWEKMLKCNEIASNRALLLECGAKLTESVESNINGESFSSLEALVSPDSPVLIKRLDADKQLVSGKSESHWWYDKTIWTFTLFSLGLLLLFIVGTISALPTGGLAPWWVLLLYFHLFFITIPCTAVSIWMLFFSTDYQQVLRIERGCGERSRLSWFSGSDVYNAKVTTFFPQAAYYYRLTIPGNWVNLAQTSIKVRYLDGDYPVKTVERAEINLLEREDGKDGMVGLILLAPSSGDYNTVEVTLNNKLFKKPLTIVQKH